MNRVPPHSSRALVASAFFFSIAVAGPTPAAALAEPTKPAGPVIDGESKDDKHPNDVLAHKHIAGVKYEDFASSAASDTQVIEAQSISWGKDAGTVYSADPMEGGQIAARTRPGRPTYGNLTATKATDTASAKLGAEASEPGKLEYPNVQGAEVAAKTSATFTTLAGKLVKGRHLVKVTITTRSGSYTLHDAIITDVTPAGDGMETVSLTYAAKD